MANPELLELLAEGTDAWDRWRDENPSLVIDLRDADLVYVHLTGVNLTGADLSGAKLEKAGLFGANLTGADLSGAKLEQTYLSAANLQDANLSRANLFCADLIGANLTGAHLERSVLSGADLTGVTGADLTGAYLEGAGLSGAKLTGANFTGANFTGANFTGAKFQGANLQGAAADQTVFAPRSLGGVHGIETVQHVMPSVVDAATLERSAADLSKDPGNRVAVEAFLRRAGVPEPIMEAFSLMIASPIEFYSCFISYSHRDKSFARRLYEAPQARGIRCWLDEHALLPGDDMKDQIDRGIRIWDKVLLCCSEDSLTSYWVEDEVDKAIEKELRLRKDRGSKVHAIIPLDLDGYLFKGWQDGRASMVRKRLAADFKGWETDNAKFEAQFEKVIKALKTERDHGPTPKL